MPRPMMSAHGRSTENTIGGIAMHGVDADDPIRVLVRELRGEQRAHVAAVCGEALVAETFDHHRTHRSAAFQKLRSGGVGFENPNPGSDGMTTSNASAGSPPCAAGIRERPDQRGSRRRSTATRE